MSAKTRRQASDKKWPNLRKVLDASKGIFNAFPDEKDVIIEDLATGEYSIIKKPTDNEVEEIKAHPNISWQS